MPLRDGMIPQHGPERLPTAAVPTCPSTPQPIPARAPLLFDTTFYIDELKGGLAPDTLALVKSRPILHAAPVLAELSLVIGLLDPKDARTATALQPIRTTLSRIPPLRTLTPTAALWVEAAVLAGILVRTQGIPRADRSKLLFLLAGDASAVLLTRNTRDFDLLLQIKPGVAVLFYDRA